MGSTVGAKSPITLKAAVQGDFLIGVALNRNQIEGRDSVALGIVKRHFSTISPENVLKWEAVHPEPDCFDFKAPDRFVELGERRALFVVGHALIWHQQTPTWVFTSEKGGPIARDTLLARMREHIQTVVGRYRGRIQGWDVVNEAFEDDGSWRKTPWYETLGEEYVARAFEYAHAADPGAELYYNDYNLWKPEKRAAALRLVASLRERGVRIDGVGEQGHWLIDDPPLGTIEKTIVDFAQSGVTLMITELDIDPLPRPRNSIGADVSKQIALKQTLDPYADGLSDSVQAQLAERYASVFRLFRKHRDTIKRVTLWGVTDADSWLNNWPIRGRTNHPLLWDRAGRPKPALDAVIRALNKQTD
jgi:endo-1,4-beta-xylanase